MTLLVVVVILFTDLIVKCGSNPAGHMKPLGNHRPPEGHIEEIMSFPDPGHFYEAYVRRNSPVLFRSILETGFLPAYQTWTDEYLREHHGAVLVDVKMQKNDREEGRQDVYTISRFLDTYKQDDIYVFDPILFKNLSNEIVVPRSLMCGGMHRIHQVKLSLSGGGTVSRLHSNVLENIKCLLDGELSIIMIDKEHIRLIQTEHWDFVNDNHEVDVKMVDMVKYPQFQNLTHVEVKMAKGDCLFIPSKWFLQVNSPSNMRNMAVNFLFRPIFNNAACSNVNLDVPLPLNDVKNMTKYIEFVRLWLAIDFFEDNSVHNMETFLRRVETNSNGMVTKSAAEKFFSFIDLNGNQEITSEELERFDFHKAAEDVPAIKDLVLEMVATALAEGVNIDFIDEPTSVENMNNYFHEEL